MAEYKTDAQVNYGFGLSFQASGKAPIIAKQIWATLADAQAYVDSSTDTATAGLILVVAKDSIDANNGVYWVKKAAGEDDNAQGVLVKVGDVTGDLTKLQEAINNNKAAIDKLNGDTDTAGSVAKTVKDAIDTATTGLVGADDTADTIRHAEALAVAAQNTADTAVQTVSTSDRYLTVTRATGSNDVTIASNGIDDAIKTATDAVKVSVTNGGYITGTVDAAGRKITLGSTTHEVSTASDTADGLATAKDVKAYVDTTAATKAAAAVDGIAAVSRANAAESDVVVTVSTAKGSVTSVAVDASVLKTAAASDAIAKANAAKTDAIAAVVGTASDTKASDTIKGAKLYADDVAKTAAAGVLVTVSGDDYVSASTDGRAVKVTATGTLVGAVDKASTALQSVSGANAITVTDKSKISLKTSDKGNVRFTNDDDGLSANVNIPAATVTGVAADDKILTLTNTLVSATVALSYEEDSTDNKKYICLKGKGGSDLGKIDASDFIKDGMVDSVAYDEKTHKLTITFNTGAGKDPIVVDLSTLVDTYKAGTGLTLATDGTFSVNTSVIATKASVDTLKTSVDANTTAIGKAKTDTAAATGLYKVIDDKVAAEVTARNTAITDAIGKLDKADEAKPGQVVSAVSEADGVITVSRRVLVAADIPTLAISKVDDLQDKLDAKANAADVDAVKVSVTSGGYITGVVDDAGRNITLGSTTQAIETASDTTNGLATAKDVKDYVDTKVSTAISEGLVWGTIQ